MKELLERLGEYRGRKLIFMEVCGTHTVSAARAGLYSLLPSNIRLISGPGCPVCVTPVGYVDHALALCSLERVIVVTFGDLMRVPGSLVDGNGGAPASLMTARARGADVRVVFSSLDALEMARGEPEREVVLLSVGFETTVPGIASTVLQAREEGIGNVSLLVANKTVIEPLRVLGGSDETRIDGFLCPGHVSVIIGPEAFRPLADEHDLRCAIAGFEPVEMLRGMAALVAQVEEDSARVDNCYPGAVRPGGNRRAREVMYRVFEPCDSEWRGLGSIPGSGLKLRSEFQELDAARRFEVTVPPPKEPRGCRCGEVLRGAIDPEQCRLFGNACTPEAPRGACMVSSEGSCAAHYHYRRKDPP
jgi:hydrogenase expression/formation protein HypD